MKTTEICMDSKNCIETKKNCMDFNKISMK